MTHYPTMGAYQDKTGPETTIFSFVKAPSYPKSEKIGLNWTLNWPLHLLLKIISLELDFDDRFLELGILKSTFYWVKLNIFVCPKLRQNRLKCSLLKIHPVVFFRTFDHDMFLIFLHEVRHLGLLKSLPYSLLNVESF